MRHQHKMVLHLEVPSRWMEKDCNGFVRPCVGQLKIKDAVYQDKTEGVVK